MAAGIASALVSLEKPLDVFAEPLDDVGAHCFVRLAREVTTPRHTAGVKPVFDEG